MKHLQMALPIWLTIILTINIAYGQRGKSVDLRWKIEQGEDLRYSTAMNELDSSFVDVDYSGLIGISPDSINNSHKEGLDAVKNFHRALKNLDYLTTLTPSGKGYVDIVITTVNDDLSENNESDTASIATKEVNKMMRSLTTGVMFRGSVYESGEIHSFWVKSNQKNLVALLFELPAEPVKVGDKWELEINLIANDHNFKCDSALKVNEVTLLEVKEIDGEVIAVLNYNIMEFVHGDFNSPSFFVSDNEPKETKMKLTHKGIGEFSVTHGRWKSYDAIMSVEASGVLTANKKTRFVLIPE